MKLAAVRDRLIFMSKKAAVLLGGVFLLVFINFTIFIKEFNFKPLDYKFLYGIQSLVPRSLDRFLSPLSLLVSFELGLLMLGLFVLLKRELKTLLVISVFLLAHGIEILGKAFFYHPGPPSQFFRYTIPFTFPSSNIKPGSSYPSGHSLRTAFLSVILFYFLSRIKSPRIKIVTYICLGLFVFVTLLSRVSLGEHWISDVIGGALLGIGSGLLSLTFL